MMKPIIKLLVAISILSLPAVFLGQGLDPASILKPATDSWPTYAGDYTQQRFSILTQINRANVHELTLAWTTPLTAGPGFGGGRGFFGRGSAPTIIGGIAKTGVDIPGSSSGSPDIKGSILQVDGVLYISSPDNAWAVDATNGRVLWHYWWKTRGGEGEIGNRGMAMYHNWVYFETPDDYLVSLDAKTGKERWHKEISDFGDQYFSTTAPVVVGDHLLVGTSDDMDAPGFIQSFDPVTGDLQWKHYNVPMAKGDPGLDTWASLDAARHGGATYWIPGSYDPETHLFIYGTGNPIPAYTADFRGPGHDTDLYTCSIVAVNVDTGKMAWYYQTSPDDTHDWDSSEAPVLVNGMFDGKMRKMVMQAARNGYFYVLDRTNGHHLLTMKFSPAANWAKGIGANGEVVRNPEKDNTIPGSLVSPQNGGATNWPPPSFDPQTNLFYVTLHEGYSMYYLTQKNPRLMTGLGGSEQDGVGSLGSFIEAIDYQTGKIAWKWRVSGSEYGYGGGLTGLLTTAGHLLFDGVGNDLAAFDVTNCKLLWRSHIGPVQDAPETYMLNGRQYVIVAARGSIFAFSLQ
jgi:alcohol dehydrogenase (cytochrome c)